MATQSSALTALYEEVMADLVPFYANQVLLPNPGLISMNYNISGTAGNTMKIPTHTAYSAGATVAEGGQIITGGSESNLAVSAVSLTVGKRGAGTVVTEEALEDGGVGVVRDAVLTQLSTAIAVATDVAGFVEMLTGNVAAITDLNQINVTNTGEAASDLGSTDIGVVWSPDSMAYAAKREPTLKMFNNVDFDRYDMVATVRNGFAQVRDNFICAIASNAAIDAATEGASLDHVSKAVATLRGQNAPTDAAGFYMAAVTPAQEFQLAKQLNGVGGLSTGAIGDLSIVGNQALVNGLVGQAVGCRFMRSNNLPQGVASA